MLLIYSKYVHLQLDLGRCNFVVGGTFGQLKKNAHVKGTLPKLFILKGQKKVKVDDIMNPHLLITSLKGPDHNPLSSNVFFLVRVALSQRGEELRISLIISMSIIVISLIFLEGTHLLTVQVEMGVYLLLE